MDDIERRANLRIELYYRSRMGEKDYSERDAIDLDTPFIESDECPTPILPIN